jgi:hypothetical protein
MATSPAGPDGPADPGLRSLPERFGFRFTCLVFIDDEVPLDLGFGAARARLVALARDSMLASASEAAYGEGVTELIRVGPLGSVPGTSKMVEVRYRNLVERDDYAGLALRWEATGAGGGLFPALDADLIVMPTGEQSSKLRLTGSYRPPLGALGSALDAAILHRVARATIRAFLSRLAAGITAFGPAISGPAAAAENDMPRVLPGSPGEPAGQG